MMQTDNTCPFSFVVPAHNSGDVLARTVAAIRDRMEGLAAEIVVVENGSTDDTWQLVESLAAGWPRSTVTIEPMRSPKGLGNALRAGILASRGNVIVLTADDLPFGFDDLDGWNGLTDEPVVAIGSKAHPESQVARSPRRVILSAGFLTLRRAIVQMRTHDPQGTFLIRRPWAHAVAAVADESGFLFTTELVYAAELAGIRPVELPVRLSANHAAHGTRVRPRDVQDMARGLLRLRARRGRLAAASRRGLENLTSAASGSSR
jgi:glycosyltransferase involved in cell wall biosynthesis